MAMVLVSASVGEEEVVLEEEEGSGPEDLRRACGVDASDGGVVVCPPASEDAEDEDELAWRLSSEGGVGCGRRGIWKCSA